MKKYKDYFSNIGFKVEAYGLEIVRLENKQTRA